MLNVLIADDDIDYAINLMNYINENNTIVRVCSIAKDGQKTLDILNDDNNIDIILLDYQMPIYNGEEILEKIENKEKYADSCIVISGEVESALRLRQCDLVHSILFKTLSMEEIKRKILQLVEYKEDIRKDEMIDKKILDEVLYLGYDVSHKGTKYLVEAVKYVFNDEYSLDNLEKFVYPIIAKKYHDTSYNIKSRIHKETNLMYYNCEIRKLKSYFKMDLDMKPRIKTVITMIINNIE